jgi:hypothetical protein
LLINIIVIIFVQFKVGYTPINEDKMSITPSKIAENTWDIKLCFKVDGELRCIKEEFVGSIKDAMLHEKQLRGLARDGGVELKAQNAPSSCSAMTTIDKFSSIYTDH